MCGIFGRINLSMTFEQLVVCTQSKFDGENNQLDAQFVMSNHRGPDGSDLMHIDTHDGEIKLGFHYLSMTSANGASQPITSKEKSTIWMVCNGEIYNWEELKLKFGLVCHTQSDCEVIIHLYRKFGTDCLFLLNGEFAFILIEYCKDQPTKIWSARDRFGVRPLFVQFDGEVLFLASEAKSIPFIADPINPDRMLFTSFDNLKNKKSLRLQSTNIVLPKPVSGLHKPLLEVQTNIFSLLCNAVQRRCQTWRGMGCMLSGGLDSTLIASLTLKYHPSPDQLLFFTVGLEGSRDILFAKLAASHLGVSQRHIVFTYSPYEGLNEIESLIFHLETYDVTTIRASIPQFLLAKFISNRTKVKALMTGEGSDELFAGYQYNKNAPNPQMLQNDIHMRLQNLYLFDNLRTDRTMASAGLEVRLPFLDHELTNYVLQLDPGLFMPKDGVEKHLLRSAVHACAPSLLPTAILWRPKDAFSDAVSANGKKTWIQHLQTHAEKLSDHDFQSFIHKYRPTLRTKEAALYMKIYMEFYGAPRRLHYWMPSWSDAEDPSATVLKNFTASQTLNS